MSQTQHLVNTCTKKNMPVDPTFHYALPHSVSMTLSYELNALRISYQNKCGDCIDVMVSEEHFSGHCFQNPQRHDLLNYIRKYYAALKFTISNSAGLFSPADQLHLALSTCDHLGIDSSRLPKLKGALVVDDAPLSELHVSLIRNRTPKVNVKAYIVVVDKVTQRGLALLHMAAWVNWRARHIAMNGSADKGAMAGIQAVRFHDLTFEYSEFQFKPIVSGLQIIGYERRDGDVLTGRPELNKSLLESRLSEDILAGLS